MIFNKHFNFEGKHAFLSPSSYAWLRYDEEHLEERFRKARAAQRGSELHDFAKDAIRLGIKLPANGSTMSAYVNDAIGFKMTPEQSLVYSDNCYGTADTISFRRSRRNGRFKLRVHDLKTGENKCKMDQLKIYDALFCLEYDFKPFDFDHELRIYQSDEVDVEEPDPDEIVHIMDTIIQWDKLIKTWRMEDELA